MFEAEGLDVPLLLRDAGIDKAELIRQDARFPVDQITRLWQLAVARVEKPTLGLQRSLAATYSNTGAVGHAMACSPDLGGALAQLSRYMAIISDATTFTLETDTRGAWLGMQHTGGSLPIPRQRVEYALLAVLVLCQWLIRRDVQPLQVEFSYSPPANDALHREAFGGPMRFNAPTNRVLLAAADMKMAIPTHHPVLGALQEKLLEDQLKQLGQTSTSSQVRTAIACRLQQGEPRRQDVAACLGLVERTLQRRPQEESASYQTLLDSTRHELARQYLAEDRHTLTDVADLLGYVDSSNFFRACKRWFGVPPAQYRASLS